MHVVGHWSLVELKRKARAEKDVRVAKRIQMVVLAIEGYTAPAIAQSVGYSRRVCQQWIARYNASGLEGLQDKTGRGRPPLHTPEEQERFKKRLDAGPTEEDRVCTFRGVDAQRILEEEFGKIRSLDAVYYLLHQLGYSSLCLALSTARPIPRPKRLLKKVFPASSSDSHAASRQATAYLFSR